MIPKVAITEWTNTVPWIDINPNLNPDNVIKCYRNYISFSDGESPSKAVYLANMEEKMQEEIFLNDIQTLLRPSLDFDPQEAWEVVRERLIERII
ncbi:hypothetical protein EZS27_006153 [termite gut metagenome]|uniref:Uncharacterized protein n=1 Tax=termite gut metagenome TaxID=433724 RepID=A0A5J4SJC8_9ZZZZ